MQGIVYRNNHQISEDVIIHTLKQLGCENIKNNHYNNEQGEKENFNGKIPDFLCEFEGKPTAIEIGVLNHSYNDRNEKIHELLKNFNYVIHLFADSKFFLLHCVLYKRKMLVSGDVLDTLRKQSEFCNNLIEELEDKQ